jgi:hypothetical protein
LLLLQLVPFSEELLANGAEVEKKKATLQLSANKHNKWVIPSLPFSLPYFPMDDRERAALLAPSPEALAQVKVFPLIANLKKDVVVSVFISCLVHKGDLLPRIRSPVREQGHCMNQPRGKLILPLR